MNKQAISFATNELPNLSIIEANELLHCIRSHVLDIGGFDIVDTQNYNTLSLMPIMSAIDDSMEALLHTRGGADYHFVNRAGIHEGEMKAANSKHNLRAKMGWTFHALAVLDNGFEDYFLLYVHTAGKPLRVYDVRDPVKVRIINEEITMASSKWKIEVVEGKRSGKNDMITLKESVVAPLFSGMTLFEYDGDTINRTTRTNIFEGQRLGVTSIYSDHLQQFVK